MSRWAKRLGFEEVSILVVLLRTGSSRPRRGEAEVGSVKFMVFGRKLYNISC